ncbi:MAG TPA: DUF4328 domain-containing protein [Pyrinomonadaceae bacterium]
MVTSENQAPAGLTASKPFVSAHGRAQVVVFLFLAYIAVSLFSVFSNLLQISFLSGALAGSVSEEGAEMNDMRQAAVALIHIVVYIALAISFLLWLHRAAKNLPALGNPQSKIDYTPGWAVGWFFVPIANLFMPYKAVREVWEKSDPAIKTEVDLAFTPAASTPLLLGWWLGWIAMNVISRATSRLGRDAVSIETMIWVTWVDVVGDLVGIVAAVLAIFVVRGIDRRQAERARHVAYVPHTPPPPPLFTPPPPPTPQGT